MLRALLVVENRAKIPRYEASWGLSIYIEASKRKLLFDVGPSFAILKRNCEEMSLDLRAIDAIFISHWHGDHAGALNDLLNFVSKPIPVYVPRARGIPHEVPCRRGERVLDVAFSTGPLGMWIVEHSLIVPLSTNSVAIFVGCSHPGVDEILNSVFQIVNAKEVALLMGGLHIGISEAPYVASVLKSFNVRMAVPAHCTSDEAIEYLRRELRGHVEVIEPYVGLEVRV